MADGHLELARMELHSRVELTAIWREGGGLEYWVRTERGVMMQISPQDALALSNVMAHGSKYPSRGFT